MADVDIFDPDRYAAAAVATLQEVGRTRRLSRKTELLKRVARQIEIAEQITSTRSRIAQAEHWVTKNSSGAKASLSQARNAWSRIHKKVMASPYTYAELGEPPPPQQWADSPPLQLNTEQIAALRAANQRTAQSANNSSALVACSYHDPFVYPRLHRDGGEIGAHEVTQSEIDELMQGKE